MLTAQPLIALPSSPSTLREPALVWSLLEKKISDGASRRSVQSRHISCDLREVSRIDFAIRVVLHGGLENASGNLLELPPQQVPRNHHAISHGLHSNVRPTSVSYEPIHLIWSSITELNAARAGKVIHEWAKEFALLMVASSANRIESEGILVEVDRQGF